MNDVSQHARRGRAHGTVWPFRKNKQDKIFILSKFLLNARNFYPSKVKTKTGQNQPSVKAIMLRKLFTWLVENSLKLNGIAIFPFKLRSTSFQSSFECSALALSMSTNTILSLDWLWDPFPKRKSIRFARCSEWINTWMDYCAKAKAKLKQARRLNWYWCSILSIQKSESRAKSHESTCTYSSQGKIVIPFLSAVCHFSDRLFRLANPIKPIEIKYQMFKCLSRPNRMRASLLLHRSYYEILSWLATRVMSSEVWSSLLYCSFYSLLILNCL